MPKISTTIQTDLVQAMTVMDNCDIYDGPMPASGDIAPSGVLLASFTVVTWDAPVSGVTAISGVPITSAAAAASGTAGYAHIYQTGFPAISMYCSVNTANAEVNLSSLTITAAGTVDINSCTMTMPAS